MWFFILELIMLVPILQVWTRFQGLGPFLVRGPMTIFLETGPRFLLAAQAKLHTQESRQTFWNESGRARGIWFLSVDLHFRRGFEVCLRFSISLAERFRITFTPNGKRQKWPRDHVYPSFAARWFQFLSKIEYFCFSMKGQNYFVLFSFMHSLF